MIATRRAAASGLHHEEVMWKRLILSTSLAFAAFSSVTGCYWRHRHHDTVIVEEHRRW